MVSDAVVSSSCTFSLKKPTRQNFDLWVYAICSLTSSHLALETPLGNYLCEPHNTGYWYASANKSTLVCRLSNGFFESYSPSSSERSSRTPRYFLVDRSSSCPRLDDMDYATVYPSKSGNHVSLHSTAPRPSVSQSSEHPSVQSLLASQPNPELWENFECDGDEWWIRDSLFAGKLCMVSDGSYMRDRHVGACSYAFIFECKETGKRATST